MKTAQNYVAPEVSVLEVAIETGFAGSGDSPIATFSNHNVVNMDDDDLN